MDCQRFVNRFRLFEPNRTDWTALRLVVIDSPNFLKLDDPPADFLLAVDALNLANESLVEPHALNRAFPGGGTSFTKQPNNVR